MEHPMKVLLLYLNYPLAMGTYFRRALERRKDIELKVAGPYSGSFIPWLHGMNLSPKYAHPGDVNLPYPPMGDKMDYQYVLHQLNGWRPDFVINVDAGLRWSEKPDVPSAAVGTDPHVLDYAHTRKVSDKFFNMQKIYSQPGDIYLPYAYDPTVWIPGEAPNPIDAAMIGMPYPQRVEWVARLQSKGVTVAFENGPVFDEARAIYQRAKIGLNWSSLLDLNARVFELMAMRLCPVINRVPDLGEWFKEGVDYLAFGTMEEAIEKVLWAKEHPETAAIIAYEAHKSVQPHTYDARIGQIFQEFGF
jgi:hypothetical protein